MSDTRPGPRAVLLKTAARLSARGPAEVFGVVAERLREAVRSQGSLHILRRPTAPGAAVRKDLVLRRAEPSDGAAYARDIGTDSPTTFRARITGDTWCYLVEQPGGRLLHATWCTTSGAWTRELQGCLVPAPGSAYVYESFTRADARGRGIYPFALEAIAADLATAGLRDIWVAVEADNLPSLRAVGKAGFAAALHISFARRWGRLSVDASTDRPPEAPRLEPRCP